MIDYHKINTKKYINIGGKIYRDKLYKTCYKQERGM